MPPSTACHSPLNQQIVPASLLVLRVTLTNFQLTVALAVTLLRESRSFPNLVRSAAVLSLLLGGRTSE